MAATAATRWWNQIDNDRLFEGAFKGGGAKGILYAGALEEFAARGYWFRAVAGSSAGAITAALVASGMTPQQIQERGSEGLGLVRFSPFGDVLARPFYGMQRI